MNKAPMDKLQRKIARHLRVAGLVRRWRGKRGAFTGRTWAK